MLGKHGESRLQRPARCAQCSAVRWSGVEWSGAVWDCQCVEEVNVLVLVCVSGREVIVRERESGGM